MGLNAWVCGLGFFLKWGCCWWWTCSWLWWIFYQDIDQEKSKKSVNPRGFSPFFVSELVLYSFRFWSFKSRYYRVYQITDIVWKQPISVISRRQWESTLKIYSIQSLFMQFFRAYPRIIGIYLQIFKAFTLKSSIKKKKGVIKFYELKSCLGYLYRLKVVDWLKKKLWLLLWIRKRNWKKLRED